MGNIVHGLINKTISEINTISAGPSDPGHDTLTAHITFIFQDGLLSPHCSDLMGSINKDSAFI